jgi:hypothetical protein
MTDLLLTVSADYNHRGAFSFGPHQGKMGPTPIITLDDGQFMTSRQIGVDYRAYVSNITF